MTDEHPSEGLERTRRAGRTLYDTTREALLAGLAVVLPLLVTVAVLSVLAGYLVGFLDVVVTALDEMGLSPSGATVVVHALVLSVGVSLVFLVGFVTRFRYGEQVVDLFDRAVMGLPGIGAIYESFRKMSDVIVEDTESFREVKLVEFPAQGIYTLGFVTARSPSAIASAVGETEMYTMFLPLAPNPVMGGHLSHVPASRVVDVDMTVEEGLQSVVTTGVAGGEEGPDRDRSLSESELREMARFEESLAGGDDETAEARTVEAPTHRGSAAYDEYAAPEDPSEEATPGAIRDYREEDSLGADEPTPGAVKASAPDATGGVSASDRSGDRLDGGVGLDSGTPEAVEAVSEHSEGDDDAVPTELARDDATTRRGDDARTPDALESDESDADEG